MPARSQMGFMRLSATRPANLPKLTREEVAQHNTLTDCWIIINQQVYNLTPYLEYHPGGAEIFFDTDTAGGDGTLLFKKYHAWISHAGLLGKHQMGYVVDKECDSLPRLSNGD